MRFQGSGNSVLVVHTHRTFGSMRILRDRHEGMYVPGRGGNHLRPRLVLTTNSTAASSEDSRELAWAGRSMNAVGYDIPVADTNLALLGFVHTRYENVPGLLSFFSLFSSSFLLRVCTSTSNSNLHLTSCIRHALRFTLYM